MRSPPVSSFTPNAALRVRVMVLGRFLDHGVDRHNICVELAKEGGEHKAGGGVSEVYGDLGEADGLSDGVDIEVLQVVGGVDLLYVVGVIDAADVVEVNTAEVFAEESAFYFALGGFIEVEAALIEELDVDHAGVEGGQAHVDAAYSAGFVGVVPGDGDGNTAQIEDVDTGRGEAGDDGALDHAGGVVAVAVDGDGGALDEGSAVCGAYFSGELGGKVDVDEAGNAPPAEERATGLSPPDER
jgi:hypothetical protein